LVNHLEAIDHRLTESTKIPSSSLILKIIDFPLIANPFSHSAKRSFRFCIPDEWFRRSKTRQLLSSSVEPSESTIKGLAALEESEEEEDEGTAKRRETSRVHPGALDWRASLSPNRLTSLFDGWIRPSPPASPTRASAIFASSDKKNVSEPRPLEPLGATTSDRMNTNQDDVEMADFEKMVVSIRRFLVQY
jgi:diaphanous 1